MKKCILLLVSAVMALSLAACTPTPEKEKAAADAQTTAGAEGAEGGPEGLVAAPTETYKADIMEERNKGSENLPTLAGVSIYRYNKTRDGLVQEMDSLESETLEPQGVLDLMASYGALPEGTELISFEQDGDKATLNLNQISTSDDAMETRLVVESLVNTFTENFELEAGLILQENGEVYTIPEVEAEDDGTMYYDTEYIKFK